jgi:hypothetical protein
MSQFLGENSMNAVCSVPMAVPQVELMAQSDSLPLSQFRLLPGQILAVPYLSLHFIGYATLGFTNRVNTGLPIVYAGVFYQPLNSGGSFELHPILHVGSDIPGVFTLNTNRAMLFTTPGIYHVTLVNNHASSSITALVTGTAQIFNVMTQNG